ncbi:ABC transporter substrate-binding protein [Novosphingobium sp. PC22D]|uniref:ABC transporter substrate-binding protein n=1 Tax=Novosphingobium sp. PC22D TaxID=1962403 RepID=UPI000BF236B3|nr:ABC transporter substrate-binding protein [Novosphingobium sp. PC22D]PEQ14149.1 ABC transporter substrate-binding protein [Novosphingobium sp. PC22D]
MAVVRSLARGALVAACAATLAACGRTDSSQLDLVVIGSPEDPFQTGARLSTAGSLATASTNEGLVSFDEQGRVVPALADRWIVTDDGQSYIFRLRDGDWLGDAGELTARSAKTAFDAALKKVRGTPLGLDVAPIEEVVVRAGRVIEIRLAHPMPNLLQLLAQPELGLRYDGESGGPMTMTPEGDRAIFVPIAPSVLGLPEIEDWETRTRAVVMSALPGDAAIKAFNDGEADLVLGGRIEDFPRTSSVGILRGTIQLDPVTGLFGLQVMNDEGFLAEAVNREALALALDRSALIAPFGLGGWAPSTRIVAPGLEGDIGTIGERWPEQSLEDRRRVAAARVALWRATRGDETEDEGEAASAAGKPPTDASAGPGLRLSVWLPDGPGADILFRGIAGDLATIGITAERAGPEEDGDLRLVDSVARYPRASWFLNRLACVNKQGLCSKEADARVGEAADATDEADRTALLAEAEAELTAANVFIPFGPPIRWSLVRGDVDGFATNPWGWHPLMPLAMLPR